MDWRKIGEGDRLHTIEQKKLGKWLVQAWLID